MEKFSRRHWFAKSFRLRTIFLLVTVSAIGSAAVSWIYNYESVDEIARLRNIQYGDESSVAYATRRLRARNPLIRNEAIFALGRFGSSAKSSVPQLQKILANDSPTDAPHAAWAIGQIGPTTPAVENTLRRSLSSPNMDTRRYAAYAIFLHKGGNLTPVPELITLLEDEQVARIAAQAFGLVGPAGAAAIPKLSSLLEFDSGANAEAALALSELSAYTTLPTSTVEKINLLTNHPEKSIRLCAVRALEKIESNSERLKNRLPDH